MRDGDVPTWPPRTSVRQKPRRLGYLDGSHRLHVEGERGSRPVESWPALKAAVWHGDLAVWTAGGLDAALRDWLPQIFAEVRAGGGAGEEWVEPWIGGEDSTTGDELIVLCLCLGVNSRIHKIRTLAPAGVWGMGDPRGKHEIDGWLARLRWLFDALGAGVHATPGSTGEHAMWPAFGTERRIKRPTLRGVEALDRYAIGGRIQTYERRQTFDVAYEIDLHNAYAAMATHVPAGPCHVVSEDGMANRLLLPATRVDGPWATWFAEAVIEITAPVDHRDLLPLAIRHPVPDDPHAIEWLWRPGGLQRVWLWREDVAHLERRITEGAPVRLVTLGEALVWPSWSQALTPWVDQLDGLRAGARSPARAQLVKLCIVAGIGRLAIPYSRRRLVPECEAEAGDRRWMPAAMPESTWRIHVEQEDRGTPMQVPAFIWSAVNRRIVETAHAEYRRDNPAIFSLTDCLGFAKRPREYSYAPATGEYGIRVHAPLTTLAAGVLLSPQKPRSVGTPRAATAELKRMGEHGPRHVFKWWGRGRDARELAYARWAEAVAAYEARWHPVDMARATGLDRWEYGA